jgi:ubiquinone/menaquinone biosynthesis C-methylase UbiE
MGDIDRAGDRSGDRPAYSHGHHESVLRSHAWRTVENSAAYLADHLRPGARVLDVGCGPGTITVDLADRVAPGAVVGIDASAEVVASARRLLAGGAHPNTCFTSGDVYAPPVADGSFDIVHAHQVLQHLEDPVWALRGLRRVLAPGGLLAARDADYGAFAWSPDDPVLDRWRATYRRLAAANGGEPDAGRYLLGWTRQAGFDDVTYTSSTWTFADPDARAWWGGLWADRCLQSAFAEQTVAFGLATPGDLHAFADAFRRWAEDRDGTFVVPHGEVVARA